MNYARSPRLVCSTTMGTSVYQVYMAQVFDCCPEGLAAFAFAFAN